MNSLDCLHGPDGVLLDGFIEKKFAWGRDPGDRHNSPAAYAIPWIGFVHNPPDIPASYNEQHQAPTDILQTACWQQSMRSCQGLFTLSTRLKEWLEQRVPVPVCGLLHPGEIPDIRFSASKYLSNHHKHVVHVGWWLRRFTSFYQLSLRTSRKLLLSLAEPWTEEARRKDLLSMSDQDTLRSVQVVPYLRNREYDDLLSSNIVFLDLYDSSANTAVVDCILRATPLLINPLPAVVEYLGRDYPLYFKSLEEAADKAEDDAAVVKAHEYLEASPIRPRLSRAHFLQSFIESDIYQRLPSSRSDDQCATVQRRDDSEARVEDLGCEQLASDPLFDLEDSLAVQLAREWNRAVAGDGQIRAQWEVVEGGRWSWEPDGVRALAGGSEWSGYQYSRCDPQVLRGLENFVVEVSVSGSARAAGLSFGPYKDFLVELTPPFGRASSKAPRRHGRRYVVVYRGWPARRARLVGRCRPTHIGSCQRPLDLQSPWCRRRSISGSYDPRGVTLLPGLDQLRRQGKGGSREPPKIRKASRRMLPLSVTLLSLL